jgi:hypothetical protein
VTTLFEDRLQDRGKGRHRQGRRPRLSLMLIDPPSVTGLPAGQLSVTPLPLPLPLSFPFPFPRARGRRMVVAIVAAVALALSAFAGVSVALTPPRRPAMFPYLTLVTPFPSTTAGAQPGATARPRAHPTMPVMTTPVTPSPAMTTAPAASPSPTASPRTPATQPTVTVTYRAVSETGGALVGEVEVTNTGHSAISGWQIVVALPHDQFTAVSGNASGYASHHILLLHPATYADKVPAGGTLSVFFTAYGRQATPELCAFNDITCG